MSMITDPVRYDHLRYFFVDMEVKKIAQGEYNHLIAIRHEVQELVEALRQACGVEYPFSCTEEQLERVLLSGTALRGLLEVLHA